MNELFLRKAILSVGSTAGGSAPLLSAKNGTKFDGFRITFEIDKTSESAPNPAKIGIYNLSKSSRGDLEDVGLACLLSAGYSGIGDGDPLVSQIFAGDIRRVYTTRQGPDLITTLEAGDAELALRNVHVEQSFAPYTSVSDIIGALVGKMGLSIGTIATAVTDVFQHGFSLSGLASDNLDKLTEKLGLEWHVTDGEVNVIAPGEALPGPAVLVNKDTGLIGFPSKRINGIIDFKSLLNPEIKPGRLIVLESGTINGTFRARTSRYRGDTNGGEFSVAVEAI